MFRLFGIFADINSAAVGIVACVSLTHVEEFPAKLLGLRVKTSSIYLYVAELFSLVIVLIYTCCQQCMRVLISPYPHQHLL